MKTIDLSEEEIFILIDALQYRYTNDIELSESESDFLLELEEKLVI